MQYAVRSENVRFIWVITAYRALRTADHTLYLPVRAFLFTVTLVLLLSAPALAQKVNTDSLWRVYSDSSRADTTRMRALRDIAYSLITPNPDSALALYQDLYTMASADSNFRFLGYSFHDRAVLLKSQAQYEQAISYNFVAMKYWIREKYDAGIASCHFNLGTVYGNMQQYQKAEEHYAQALDYFISINSERQISGIYNDLGNMYRMKGGVDSLALDYLNKSLEIRTRINYEMGIAATCNNIAGVYFNMNQYDTALKYMRIYQAYAYKSGRKSYIVQALNNIGSIYNQMGRHAQGRDSCHKAYLKSFEYDLYRDRKVACECLHESYLGLKNSDSALLYYTRFIEARDSLSSLAREDEIARMEVKFEYEQKAIADSLITLEKTKIDEQRALGERNTRYALLTGLVLKLIFGGVMFNRFRITRRQKNLIARQQEETELQKRLIEEKNKEITDSINYAQRIQQAVLPSEQELKKAFTDVFVLFDPRDIVSGDFYWYDESRHNKVIAVADCTGHGVPGGFMSMLGFEILQDVVMLEEITTTAEALRRLDHKVTNALNKNDRSYRDGMDMALCAFAKDKMELHFSGANRPLLHFSNGKMTIIKPDKHTIGGAIDDVQKEFTSHIVPLQPGDMIYLFSDGYADQFGGGDGKKFMSKKFEQLLSSIAGLDCAEQKAKLKSAFHAWKGALEQVDDVCVVGIRI